MKNRILTLGNRRMHEDEPKTDALPEVDAAMRTEHIEKITMELQSIADFASSAFEMLESIDRCFYGYNDQIRVGESIILNARVKEIRESWDLVEKSLAVVNQLDGVEPC